MQSLWQRGSQHTCALLADGTVTCWGMILTLQEKPEVIQGITGATALASGRNFACALVEGGAVSCWGKNNYGQLGNGTTTDSTTPIEVPGILGAKAIAAGVDFSCALLSDGSAKCWGANAYGQLGSGDYVAYTAPVSVMGLMGATGLAVSGAGSSSMSYSRACAIFADGAVSCWGSNMNGALGIGTSIGPDDPSTKTSSMKPIAAAIADAKSVSLGALHGCAVTTTGAIKCWGSDNKGQIANGTLIPISVPNVAGAAAIAAADETTCVVLADGTAKCWGDNSSGKLGNMTKYEVSPSPAFEPVEVLSIANATGISLSTSIFGCATLTSSEVSCWGHRPDLATTADMVFTPAVVEGLPIVSSVATGADHSCAVATDSTVWCWGDGTATLLGIGSANVARGQKVQLPNLTGVTAIGAAHHSTCAILSDGSIKCWGENRSGQLGNGSTASSNAPKAVSNLRGAIALSIGADVNYSHTCAALADGGVRCWGDNTTGCLGDGTTVDRSIPVATLGISNAIAVSAGVKHTCALMADGTVKCWGSNSFGQLGNWSMESSTTPVSVFGLSGVKAIAAGAEHTCAILSDQTVKCWGNNAMGEIGTGTTVPVEVLYL